MGLLPGAHPLGILLIPEIILVLRLGQPAALGLSLSGSVALSLVAVVLMVPIAKIGKKKFLAVVALTLTPRSLHRFQNQKQPLFGKLAREPEENPSGRRLSERRRKKNIRRIDRRKSTGRRSTSRLAVLIQFQFSGDTLTRPAPRLHQNPPFRISGQQSAPALCSVGQGGIGQIPLSFPT